MKTKYFCVSDLHGTHPKHLILSLMNAGFENENTSHQVVVAGDITDGLGNDEKLIKSLMAYDKANQLIAVKGNHDLWTLNYKPMNSVWLSEESRRWLMELPYQINHKDFYLAHGIYLEKLGKDYNYESTWGSPCLIEHPTFDWWSVDRYAHEKIHDKWPTINDYIKSHNDKPMIIGHFWPSTVKERMDWRNELKYKDLIDFTQDEKGFVSIENIHYVDSDVLHATPFGSVKIKVLEL